MAKKKDKNNSEEPFYFVLNIDGVETEIPIEFKQALLLYNSLSYYIRSSGKEPEFLN